MAVREKFITNQMIQDVLDEDWSFAHVKRSETLWGSHGYHRYPAKFIPQLVRRIIELYSDPGDYVGDLFVGSGTTGIEALRTKRRFYGSDVNPVALLISKAKVTPIQPEKLQRDSFHVFERTENIERIGRRKLFEEEKEYIVSFDLRGAEWHERVNYWFPQSHRIVIAQLLERILEVDDTPVRQFFLCAFSNILRRCSIWLSGSTKAQKDINRSLGDPVEEFQKQVRDMMRRNRLYWEDLAHHGFDPQSATSHFDISFQDARHPEIEPNSFDLLVTSPPYATCYDYRQLHQLTELWFEPYGIIETIDNELTWIGSDEATTRREKADYSGDNTGSSLADTVLEKLESESQTNNDIRAEARALRYYFLDMHRVVQQFHRVIVPGKRLAIVIGDSYKRGVSIPTSDILQELAIQSGFEFESRISRRVPGRVLVSKRDKQTGRFSSTASSDTEVYPEEYILVLRKPGQ